MDDDRWVHSDEGFKRVLLELLERITEALEFQIQHELGHLSQIDCDRYVRSLDAR